MQRTKTKTWAFLGGFAVLMLLFTFLDLPISKALFDLSSPFGNLFAGLAELPCTLVGVFSCAALAVTRPRENKALAALNIAGFGVLMALFALMAGVMPTGYLPLPKAFMLTGVVYAAAAILLAVKISKKQAAALRRAAALGLLLVLAAMIIVNIVKVFWGRPRMRSMTDPDSQFTLWFIPQGFTADDECKSFPSGHSANAACILWITLLPTFLPRLRTNKAHIALYCVAFGWMALSMLSRVIMGAHFATDVTMGAAITVCCFYLLKRVFYSKEAVLFEPEKL
ncbi:phosphatase PAP2 family protein [Allofournierella sp.]|uniref:phosphatase PAP2 family protein n=1 Tax=Allofournierella sp. TaxID=1940256 RepID=UPI003AB85BC6